MSHRADHHTAIMWQRPCPSQGAILCSYHLFAAVQEMLTNILEPQQPDGRNGVDLADWPQSQKLFSVSQEISIEWGVWGRGCGHSDTGSVGGIVDKGGLMQ